MSLLKRGAGLFRTGTEQLGNVAKLDAQDKQANDQREMARESQNAATMGQVTGIGAAEGLRAAREVGAPLRDSLSTLNKIAPDAGTFSSAKGGLFYTPTGGEAQAITAASDIASVAPGVVDGAIAAGTEAVAVESAATTAIGASGTGGAGATLAAAAGPLALAVGAGFLLNKLFS
jgi:hypothetical protein|tara:strand:+ start:1152 stop:1676 length:525 start_codon:yes stop_codon:yes gene_type:complete